MSPKAHKKGNKHLYISCFFWQKIGSKEFLKRQRKSKQYIPKIQQDRKLEKVTSTRLEFLNSIQFLEPLDFLHSKPKVNKGGRLWEWLISFLEVGDWMGWNFSASHVENLGGCFGAGTPLNREAKHLSATWQSLWNKKPRNFMFYWCFWMCWLLSQLNFFFKWQKSWQRFVLVSNNQITPQKTYKITTITITQLSHDICWDVKERMGSCKSDVVFLRF